MSKLHLSSTPLSSFLSYSLCPLPFSFGSLNTIFSSCLLLSVLCRSLKSYSPYYFNLVSPVNLILDKYTSINKFLTYNLTKVVFEMVGKTEKYSFFSALHFLPGYHQQLLISCPCLPSYLITLKSRSWFF